MTLLTPGLVSQRQTRSSRLILGWRASDGVIEPYTGQAAAFGATAGPSASTVVGANVNTIFGGRGMPRFTQADGDGVTRLEMRSDSASFDVEEYGVGLTLPVQAISILVRVVPMYTKASSQSPAKQLWTWGTDVNVGAGTWTLARSGTGWTASRNRVATTISGNLAESGSVTYPVDVLVTMSAAGAQVLSTRDAVGVTASAGAGTSAAMVTAGELLSTVGFGCSGIGGLTGGWWRLESWKMARGVLTFAQLDGLS